MTMGLTYFTRFFIRKWFYWNRITGGCLFLMIFVLGCWDKQEHEITAPELANYPLKGYVRDIDFNVGLDSITVRIEAVQLLEAPGFTTKTTMTDINGYFAFDSIYVGAYNLDFYRDGYLAFTRGYFQNYNDTTALEIDLPDIYYIGAAQKIQAYEEFQNYTPTKFSFHPTKWYLLILNYSGIHRFKWESTLQQWTLLNSYTIPLEDYNINDLNIAFGTDATYFYLVQKPDLVHKILINVGFLEIEQSFSVTHFVWDIYCSKNNLYIPSENQIYIYDESPFSLQLSETINRPDITIACFYRDNLYYWAADNISGRLYQCDAKMNILRTYIPITANGSILINEMSVDFVNKVWFNY